jgi:hypothetical protein
MIWDCAPHRRNETKLYVLCAVNHSQWPRGLRRTSAAARLLRLWARIPPGACVVSVVCCQVESLRRADHQSRGVLPTVVRRCVWIRNLVNEEALTHWGCCAKIKNHSHTNLVRYIQLLLFTSPIIPPFPVWLTIYGKSYVYLRISQGKRFFGSCPSLESSDVFL